MSTLNTIIEYIKKQGYNTISEDWYGRVRNWRSWYEGDVAKFHHYKVYNGQKHVDCRRLSLGMAKKVSEDWANLLMNERVNITLDDEMTQDFVLEVLEDNNFMVRMNEMQERKAALGTTAYVPWVETAVDDTGRMLSGAETRIHINYQTIEDIYPLSWENGRITECAFGAQKTIGSQKYYFLQLHVKNDAGQYVIKNRLFRADNDALTPVEDFRKEKGFENLAIEVQTGSDERQFVIDRLNIANNLDLDNPAGIPVYANALDILMGIDTTYDSYINEFVMGKKRIMVKAEATSFDNDGNPTFDPNDLIYYRMPEDASNESFLKEIDFTIRSEEHNKGINDGLNLLSTKCGFGERHYRFDTGTVSTATQVISENSEMFRVLKKHEQILEAVIKELIHIVIRLGNQTMGLSLREDAEITIDFDDSIIEDKQSEFARDLQMVNMGVMRLEEFRSKHMNEDIETALKNLPADQSFITEGGFDNSAQLPGKGKSTGEEQQKVEAAKEIAGKSLNGAQTQSLMGVIAQYTQGSLTMGQAINLISVAIGVTREEAKKILEGTQ